MKKVVYNACFGGFGLSPLATKRYAELCGRECYFFANPRRNGHTDLENFIEVSAEDAGEYVIWYAYDTREALEWLKMERTWKDWPLDRRQQHNEMTSKHSLYYRGIARDDPLLVQVVEELGEKANGCHANLKIREIPTGTKYRIDEYDGSESVMTIDDYEWETA